MFEYSKKCPHCGENIVVKGLLKRDAFATIDHHIEQCKLMLVERIGNYIAHNCKFCKSTGDCQLYKILTIQNAVIAFSASPYDCSRRNIEGGAKIITYKMVEDVG